MVQQSDFSQRENKNLIASKKYLALFFTDNIFQLYFKSRFSVFIMKFQVFRLVKSVTTFAILTP